MESIQTRAKEQLSPVLLTLLSIIQALALELLWSKLGQAGHLWGGGLAAVFGWPEVVALFQGILLVWLFYTSLVMRLRWVPSMRDSVTPFLIGLLEFCLIELLGPDSMSRWFLMLGVIFAVSSWTSVSIFGRAGRDPDNRELFERYSGSAMRDSAPSFMFGAVLAVVAGLLALVDGLGWIAMIGILLANGAMLGQMELLRRYWNRSLADPALPTALPSGSDG